jgi:hypothetical protein
MPRAGRTGRGGALLRAKAWERGGRLRPRWGWGWGSRARSRSRKRFPQAAPYVRAWVRR